jgi:hypothetical protein
LLFIKNTVAMETHFTWKTKLFSRKYEIYKYNAPAGEVTNKNWSKKSVCELNGNKFIFETKGFFKAETHIIDSADNLDIGTIKYTTWKRKPIINLRDREYRWQFDNFFNTRWSVSNENGFLVKYHSRAFKGTIDSYTDDEALILAGFYIRNYYKQKSEAVAAST